MRTLQAYAAASALAACSSGLPACSFFTRGPMRRSTPCTTVCMLLNLAVSQSPWATRPASTSCQFGQWGTEGARNVGQLQHLHPHPVAACCFTLLLSTAGTHSTPTPARTGDRHGRWMSAVVGGGPSPGAAVPRSTAGPWQQGMGGFPGWGGSDRARERGGQGPHRGSCHKTVAPRARQHWSEWWPGNLIAAAALSNNRQPPAEQRQGMAAAATRQPQCEARAVDPSARAAAAAATTDGCDTAPRSVLLISCGPCGGLQGAQEISVGQIEGGAQPLQERCQGGWSGQRRAH